MDSRELAYEIRKSSLEMVTRAKASHIGSALSIADLVACLYAGHLRVQPNDPSDPRRDRFILSKGHACVAVYAALAELGFFPKAELETYGVDHSRLMNHISHKVPGVEFSTGSLGHGLPFGVGKAMAAKRLGSDWRTFVLMSDGELDEGSNWEAFMFAAHHALDNITAIVDYNKLQSLTTVASTLGLEPLRAKFEAFGWQVIEVDGHNHDEINAALASLPFAKGQPSMLLAHTTKGKGVSFMENKVEWHYRSPTDELFNQALTELNLSNA